jgi:hypothetical protein
VPEARAPSTLPDVEFQDMRPKFANKLTPM